MTSANDEHVAKLYREVPAEQRDMLQRFRADHPRKKLTHGEIEWQYVDTERGE